MTKTRTLHDLSSALFLCSLALVSACAHRVDGTNAMIIASSRQNSVTVENKKNMQSETEIRQLIDGFVNAIRAKDINGVMSVFAPEVVSFDFGPPLQHGGGNDFVKRWQELFEAYTGPIEYEVHHLSIRANGDLAFTHSLNRISGMTKAGKQSERWLRWTACYQKINGKWLIVHEHVSVPTDVKSGRALFNLTP